MIIVDTSKHSESALPAQYATSKKPHVLQELDTDVGVGIEEGEEQLLRKTVGT